MKTLLKVLADFLARLVVLPAVGLYWLGAGLAGRERALRGWSEAMSLLPGTCGVYLRRAFYWYVLAECGPDCWIGFGVLVHSPKARIGKNVYIGPYCSLGEVTLEEDVLLSTGVSVINGPGQHGLDRLDQPIRQQPGQWPPVRIGPDAWIGERAVVMADVGAHGVVGAGAVVTRPIPDYAVAVGVPARVIRYRNQPEGTDPKSSAHPPVPSAPPAPENAQFPTSDGPETLPSRAAPPADPPSGPPSSDTPDSPGP